MPLILGLGDLYGVEPIAKLKINLSKERCVLHNSCFLFSLMKD